MGIGSLVFVVPHFIAEANSEMLANNKSEENICRMPRSLEQEIGGLVRLSQASNLRPDNCIKVRSIPSKTTSQLRLETGDYGDLRPYARSLMTTMV